MRELRFVAVSEDGRGLVLGDTMPGSGGEHGAGGEYTLLIDDALRAAVRQDRSRLGHLQVEPEAVRPRDIQARIRAGETAEDVALAAGIALEKVRRYEGPVLAEREHVASQAQSATVRDTGSAEGPAPRLGELVSSRFEPLGVDLTVLGWDAWRREDGRWVVRLAYPEGTRARAALWLYDPERRVVLPQDENARGLVDGSEPQDPRARATGAPDQRTGERRGSEQHGRDPRDAQDAQDARDRGHSDRGHPDRDLRESDAATGDAFAEASPSPVRRLSSVPREPDSAATVPSAGEYRGVGPTEGFVPSPTPLDVQLPLDGGAEEGHGEHSRAGDQGSPGAGTPRASGADEAATGTDGTPTGADRADGPGADTPRHAADPARKPVRGSRRAAVPSWDDIVFGARKKD